MALSTVRRAAFVTLDLQPLICSFMDDGQRDALVSRVNKTMAQARRHNVPIAHVRVAFQPGHPEIHESHPIMGPAKQGNVLVDGTPEAAMLPELDRDPSEPVHQSPRERIHDDGPRELGFRAPDHRTRRLRRRHGPRGPKDGRPRHRPGFGSDGAVGLVC